MPKTRPEYEEQHRNDTATIFNLSRDVERLNEQNKILKEICTVSVNALKQTHTRGGVSDSANSGTAGRRRKLTGNTILIIKYFRREERLSQREIANITGLSLGTVNKACKSFDSPQV